ncbi:MAG: hypothetical protein ACK52J_02370 [bacterium]|jgi:hypothetical protein
MFSDKVHSVCIKTNIRVKKAINTITNDVVAIKIIEKSSLNHSSLDCLK